VCNQEIWAVTFLPHDSVYKATLFLIHLSKQCQLVTNLYVKFFYKPLKIALHPKLGCDTQVEKHSYKKVKNLEIIRQQTFPNYL
jgi:hypothetical protein